MTTAHVGGETSTQLNWGFASVGEKHPRYPEIDWNDCVKITVVQSSIFDVPFWNKSCEGTLAIFQKWLQEQIDQIPEPFRHAADIEIDSEGGWEGEHHATIEITYWRPANAAEIAERHAETQDREKANAEAARKVAEDSLKVWKAYAAKHGIEP